MEPAFAVPYAHIVPTAVPYRGEQKMTMIKAAGSTPSFQKRNGRLAWPDAFATHPASIAPV